MVTALKSSTGDDEARTPCMTKLARRSNANHVPDVVRVLLELPVNRTGLLVVGVDIVVVEVLLVPRLLP
jgi:hypothetical protein